MFETINTDKSYCPPVIMKIHNQLMAKHGIPTSKGQLEVRPDIDGVSIDKLADEFGSPLFVYSEKTIRETYKRMSSAFSERYPKTRFAWSYKTNYLKSICALYHKMGSIAEVVSEFEYQKARRLGVKGENIIFNGPCKPMNALKQAIEDGAKINIDSFEEINTLEAASRGRSGKTAVGLRINLDVGIYPQWSRFGFNFENGQALDAVKRIQIGDLLKINGLHCHIGTYILDPLAYGRMIDKLFMLSRQIEEHTGQRMEYLDIGGGFPSHSRLKNVYQPPEITVPDIEDYAEAITAALLRNIKDGHAPVLYLESGRSLIDEAGYLVASLVSAKYLPDGRRANILDAGVNLLYTSTWYDHRVEVASPTNGLPEPSVLYGPLCMNIDVVKEQISMPKLRAGTRLVLSPVGAYNVTQSMQFIHCRPPVVLVRENGRVEVIRRAETIEDIEIGEKLPEDLRMTS